MRNKEPLLYYSSVSALAMEDISFFEKFCQAVSINTDAVKRDFLIYVSKFNYRFLPSEYNPLKIMAEIMLEKKYYGDFSLPYGCYVNNKITNLINLTSLGETLLSLNIRLNENHQNITVIHDRIAEFEKEYTDTLKYRDNITLLFDDSKNNLLIQYADNIAGIVRKSFTNTVCTFRDKKQWCEGHDFFPHSMSNLLNNISINNFKFDTQICDWALAYCVRDMFSPFFSKEKRNNIEFNERYLYYTKKIEYMIPHTNYDVQ